jgi:hypothetical protein
VTSGKKTISVFNTYALNKMRRGVLTPRVAVQNPMIIPTLFFFVGEVICLFTVNNPEDFRVAGLALPDARRTPRLRSLLTANAHPVKRQPECSS